VDDLGSKKHSWELVFVFYYFITSKANF
jgi:hypothetical protein